MSGPLAQQDTTAAHGTAPPAPAPGPTLEVTAAHIAEVGGLAVHRALPRRGRRTVGAWCFADHFGPVPRDRDVAMNVGPHPHIGLQTVTWLLRGEVLHTDSIGSEQTIRPGQLNLMSAGHGVAHAEESLDHRGMHGMQLWIAQPESTRHTAPAFEHHENLPEVEVEGARITVISGSVAGTRSPARTDTELVGAQITVHGGETTIPLRSDFEHALIVLDNPVQINGVEVAPSALAYLGNGRDEVAIGGAGGTRALLIGGTPFEAAPLMWWNFVARTPEEIAAARRDWEEASERFGAVRSHLARIEAPPLPRLAP